MNKEQSADRSLVDLIDKNMLNSTISMSYPDVVIAYGNAESIEHSRAIEAALVSAIII